MLASTSNPAVRRVIPVEGIEKPSIDLPCKGTDLQVNNPPRIGPIITRNRAQRATKNIDDETDGELNDRPSPNERPIRTTRTATIPKEAVQETNHEAHEAFQKALEARPDWRIPIYNYIKDAELPNDRWEARKIKS